MKKGIICALALPLAAGALSAIGATSKNVSEAKAEAGDMPAYTEKVVSISAARTRMPAAKTPTRVGIEFQALGTDWTGAYCAVCDAGYPKLASTFNMKDFIQIDGQAYTFWNSQDFRAIVQDGWMEPAFKISDMATKTGMVVTLKKGLKLPSRQYINNLNAGLAAEPDKSSWETPADVYTLDATYTITFKAVSDYETQLNAAGGCPMSVEKIEVDHTDIAKEGDRYWLQSVNCVAAASNRFSFNLCVDANTANDFPSGVVNNGNYYTNGDGKAITELAEAPSGLTKDFMLQRALSLNILHGNMILDGEPITYVYNTDGERNASGFNKVSFFDTTKGRIVMNKNSDGRVKVTADVIVPNFATGTHRFMIKKGTEFPSWSYIMGVPLGKTASNGVYKLQKDLVWDLTFTAAGACTVTPIARGDSELPIPEKVDSFGLADRLKFDINGGDAFRIWMNPISEYTRCIDGDDPHGYYTNRSKDQNIHYGEATDYATHGNANQLHVWDHVLINGQPAPNYYRDSRLHINGVSSSNVGFQDGKVYGSFWFEVLETKAISGTADDTLSIKFLKGMQLPTQETANGTDKATYLELDQDTEFILVHKQGEAKTAWTVQKVIRSNGEFNTEPTAIKSMRLTAGDEGDSRAMFDLSAYDYEGGFNQFNCGSLILGGEYNIIDNMLINDGKDTTPSIPASSLGYAHNRYFRVPVNKGAVGYNMGTSPSAPSFNQVTIKAGTRFPAFSYLNNGGTSVDVNATPKKANEKFYETELDVTLFHVGNGVFKTLADVHTDAVAELSKEYSRDAYREAEQATYDAEVDKINASASKIQADEAVVAAKAVIGTLKTNAAYIAEELQAAKDAAKSELEAYVDPENYIQNAAELVAAIGVGKASIDACDVIEAVSGALADAKALIDDIMTDAEEAAAVDTLIAEIGTVTLDSKDAIEAAEAAYAALDAAVKEMVKNHETLVKARADYDLLAYKKTQCDYVDATIKEIRNNYSESVQTQIDGYVASELKPAIMDAENYAAVDKAVTDGLAELEKLPYAIEEEDVQAVVEAITDLMPVEELTINDRSGVEAARTAFDELTPREKAFLAKRGAYEQDLESIEAKMFALVKADVLGQIASFKESFEAEGKIGYSDANIAVINGLFASAKTAAEEAESLQEVEVIVPALMNAIMEVDTLWNEGVARVMEHCQGLNEEDYSEAGAAAIEGILVKFYEDMEASMLAGDPSQIEGLVSGAIAAIDAVPTKAQEALAAAKVSAKAELDAAKAALDLTKYDDAGKAALDKAVADGKVAIDAAATQEAVANAKAAAVAALNAVPQKADPTPAKKGCGGSIIAASGVVTLVTLLGAGLILAKKRKEN